jgi:hypothetical protein
MTNVFVRRESYTASDSEPWNKNAGSTSRQDYPVKAAFLDNDSRDLLLSIPGQPDQKTTVERSLDRAVYIPAESLPIDVTIADTIVDGDRVWEITQVQLIKPGPTPVVWVLKVAN